MWQPILRCRGLALCIIFAVVAVTMLVPGTAISRVDVTLEVKREMKFGEFAADISGGGTVVLSAFADTVPLARTLPRSTMKAGTTRISARILSHHWGRFMCGPI